jgi:hypothetical protein
MPPERLAEVAARTDTSLADSDLGTASRRASGRSRGRSDQITADP